MPYGPGLPTLYILSRVHLTSSRVFINENFLEIKQERTVFTYQHSRERFTKRKKYKQKWKKKIKD